MDNDQKQTDDDIDINQETASSPVREIIKKYNLKDFNESDIENLESEGTFIIPGAVINDIAKKIALSTISDKEAETLLESYLDIPKRNSGELVKDIKIKIVPIFKKILEGQKNKSEKTPSDNGKDIKSSELLTPTIGEKLNSNPTPIKKRVGIKTEQPEIQEKKQPPRSGPDNYREPIQ